MGIKECPRNCTTRENAGINRHNELMHLLATKQWVEAMLQHRGMKALPAK